MDNEDKINELNKLILDLKKQLEEKRKGAYSEAHKKALKKYYKEHKDKLIEYMKKYRIENKEKVNEYQRNYHKYKMETDPDYKARFNERMRKNHHKRKEKLNNI